MPARSGQGTIMEMHQVRYFLAVARVLNFTRAADECNVTQPSLTRAIKQLESELGGDLFRRERPAAQLTELRGRRESRVPIAPMGPVQRKHGGGRTTGSTEPVPQICTGR